MWPNGLGLMFFNGVNGLIYYCSKASRVFVSNGGIIATIAVGGYYFPGGTIAGIGGAVAIRGATWLTKKVDDSYHVHLADLIDKLVDVMPQTVRQGYIQSVETIGTPQRQVTRSIMEARGGIGSIPQLNWVNDSLAFEVISPLLEEAIYRLGIQEGLSTGLIALGVPSATANFLSGAISTTLFAGGHNPDPSDQKFRQTFIAGIGFGLMMYLYGLPASVVAHSANNAGIRLQRALGF